MKYEENTTKTPRNYTEDRNRRHSLTRRAHLEEETGAPRNMHERIRLWAHKSACQRRMRTRGGKVGPASRPGAFREGVLAKAPDLLPYVHLAGTDPE